MAVLVVYDISDDKLRARLARRLEAMGYVRIQRSVWVNPYGYSDEAVRTYRRLKNLPYGEEDRVHVFIIPRWSYEKAISIGREKPPKPELGTLKIF